jgi:hypothetical protein
LILTLLMPLLTLLRHWYIFDIDIFDLILLLLRHWYWYIITLMPLLRHYYTPWYIITLLILLRHYAINIDIIIILIISLIIITPLIGHIEIWHRLQTEPLYWLRHYWLLIITPLLMTHYADWCHDYYYYYAIIAITPLTLLLRHWLLRH